MNKITLNEYLKENTPLLSTFSLFIAGAVSATSFMPGFMGVILAVIFCFLSIYLLMEIMDTYESTNFTDSYHKHILIFLAAILGLLYVHIGLYAKIYMNVFFYIALSISIFILFFIIAIVLGLTKKRVGMPVRYIVVFILGIVSIFLSWGIYLTKNGDINTHVSKYYIMKVN